MIEFVKQAIELGSSFKGALREGMAKIPNPPASQKELCHIAGTSEYFGSETMMLKRVPNSALLITFADLMGGTPADWLEMWLDCATRQAYEQLERELGARKTMAA